MFYFKGKSYDGDGGCCAFTHMWNGNEKFSSPRCGGMSKWKDGGEKNLIKEKYQRVSCRTNMYTCERKSSGYDSVCILL